MSVYKKIHLVFLLAILALFLFSGLAWADSINWEQGYAEAIGRGVPPATANTVAQGNLLAQRAAKVDAYRNLLEMFKGVRVNAQTTVRDLMVENDTINTKVMGFIRGAEVVSQEQMPDGSYQVVVRAPIFGVTGLESIIPNIPRKIVLEKNGDSATLNSSDININLNWYHGQKDTAKPKVDLDLGCFYELQSGKKDVIQALDKNFGSFEQPPYIKLDLDDRTGSVVTGENIKINGKKFSELKRVLVYTFIYGGVANWSEIDGEVTIKQPGSQDIIVRLNEPDSGKSECAIIAIDNVGNGKLKVTRLVQYFSRHKEIDDAYNWGFRWVAGKKD